MSTASSCCAVVLVTDHARVRCAGSTSPQRFTPYGALYGAPLQDDGVVWGRKDYSYTEPTAGAHRWRRLAC
jgi:hypothetical protein